MKRTGMRFQKYLARMKDQHVITNKWNVPFKEMLSANELIISWTIRNQRKTKDTRWRGLEGVSVPWMGLASCSFSRLSKEIENETHGGWGGKTAPE